MQLHVHSVRARVHVHVHVHVHVPICMHAYTRARRPAGNNERLTRPHTLEVNILTSNRVENGSQGAPERLE